jgi:Glycosyl-4,4'-diaponeurosporenoate acyltransferase
MRHYKISGPRRNTPSEILAPHSVGLPSPFLLACCNAAPNVFWSTLAFVPLSIFCYQLMERFWLYAFGLLSLSAYIVPTSWFRHLELSSKPTVYRRLGVAWVNRFVQDGTLINGWLRRKYPQYRRIRSRTFAIHMARTSHYQERFHWAMFLFFLLCSLFAGVHKHMGWALILILTNVIYNLYPIWLQQYIRIRLSRSRLLL